LAPAVEHGYQNTTFVVCKASLLYPAVLYLCKCFLLGLSLNLTESLLHDLELATVLSQRAEEHLSLHNFFQVLSEQILDVASLSAF
jgi:hypothetical protein